jgi:hypothetical protein
MRPAPGSAAAAMTLPTRVAEMETNMTWTWRCEDADGIVVSGPEETFASQSDAESWLGQHWRDLVASGAANATLFDDERVEYRMSLAPAGQ